LGARKPSNMVDLRFLANTPPFTWANLSARATADAQPGKVIPRIFPDAGVSALLLMQHYPLVHNDNHVCDEHLHRIVQLQQLGCLPKTMVQATRSSSHQCNAIAALLVQILQHLHIASLVREVALQSQCQADMAQGNLTIGEVAQRPRLQKTSKKLQKNVHTYRYIYIYTSIYKFVYIYIYMCTYVYTYAYIHRYVNAYLYKYIFI